MNMNSGGDGELKTEELWISETGNYAVILLSECSPHSKQRETRYSWFLTFLEETTTCCELLLD